MALLFCNKTQRKKIEQHRAMKHTLAGTSSNKSKQNTRRRTQDAHRHAHARKNEQQQIKTKHTQTHTRRTQTCTRTHADKNGVSYASSVATGTCGVSLTDSRSLSSRATWSWSVRGFFSCRALRRFGESLNAEAAPLSSPTMMMGLFLLKATCVSLAFFVTCCWQMGSYLFCCRSNTCTFPSVVTAAKTHEEYGDHATQPTALPRSKVNTGSSSWSSQIFSVQSALHDANTRGWKGFHTTEYTAIVCALNVLRNFDVYAREHWWTLPSSVPMRNTFSRCWLKSRHVPAPSPKIGSVVLAVAATAAVAVTVAPTTAVAPVAAAAAVVAAAVDFGDVSSSSLMTSVCCSSFCSIVHVVTRPSEETELKLRFWSTSSSCHSTLHTGSVCLPVLAVERTSGDSLLRLRLRSNTATDPSYMPAASSDACFGCTSIAITPLLVGSMYSGCDGFLSEYAQMAPPDW